MIFRPQICILTVLLAGGLLAGRPLATSAESRPQEPASASTASSVRGENTRLPASRRLWAGLAPLPERAAPTAPISPVGSSPGASAGQIEKALQLLQSRYYGTPPNRSALKFAAVRGMVDSLGDRYTRFLDPEQFRRMNEENSGQYGGIGVLLTLNAQNQAEVSQVDLDGPAKGAGIRVGDIVTEVAGHPIRTGHAAAERAQSLLHGNPGTKVALTLRRKGAKAPLRYVLSRKLIYTPTVTARLLGKGVGYIKIETFGDRSDEEVGVALRRLKSRGMKALVLDMRGNPGGFFNAAVDIASRFVDKGPVVYTKDRDNRRVPVPNIPSKRLTPKIPVAVLVDKWSASAAEIVAAAIQDTGAGIVIGQPTYGKALVQTITPNPDGSAILITTHHYYTPLGTDLSRRGVKPNILVERSPRAPAADLPLQRALAYLADPSQNRVSIRSIRK